MDVGSPLNDVLPGARGAVLRILAQIATPLTVRELARQAGVSPQGALSVVNEFAEAGIATTLRAGGALMVSLNHDHLAAEPLMALVRGRARLVQRLTDELAGWDGLAAAWLFGSAARGDGDRGSDIDLLLVATRSTGTSRWSDQAATLAQRVEAWTGNPVQLVEHTRRSLSELVDGDNALVAAIRREGIPLTPASRRLLRRAA